MTIATQDASSAPVDLAAIKTKQQAMWASGDFAVIGTTLQIVGELLCEAVDVGGGERVLDVAAGNGNATLAAARRFARVTSTDYVPGLLEGGRRRAAAEGLDITFEVADAEALPYPNGSFDVLLSTFGVMFAPDHQRAADELLRVCRSGGRVALGNWVPDGFVGEMFRTVSSHAPPPRGVTPPPLWGTEDHVRELFGDRISELRTTRRTVMQRFRSSEHWIEVFRTWFGPIKMAFARVGPDGEEALAADLRDLHERYNVDDRSLVLPSDYLEIVATKR